MTEQDVWTVKYAPPPAPRPLMTMSEIMAFARLVAESDLAPKDYRSKPGNCAVAIKMGQEVGLDAMQAIQNIAVINGRPSVWGDAMLAIVQAHPDCVDVREEATDQGATCTVIRRNREPVVRTFTLDDAKKAQLIGKQGPWTQYPKRMLQMRARAFALRDAFADALRGLNSAEEQRDVIDVTPEPVHAPPAQQHTPPRNDAPQADTSGTITAEFEAEVRALTNAMDLVYEAEGLGGVSKWWREHAREIKALPDEFLVTVDAHKEHLKAHAVKSESKGGE